MREMSELYKEKGERLYLPEEEVAKEGEQG